MTTNESKRLEDGRERRLFNMRSSAAYLSLSYWSVRSMVLSGTIPHVRYGKRILVDKADLDRWIQDGKLIGV